ncbi:MAG: MBL fold metallo-hydrolase [Syntrophomonadaceae bacterium]|nr:MBL fold metallo-hydrolase [Syntrophomonadaceae bacterium]
MISNALGHLMNHAYKLGNQDCPVFLLDGPEPIVIDSGVTCAAELYAAAIRSVLGTRQPSILFLTHVHWDHCGGAAYLKKAFPAMKIAVSRQGEKILARPNALALIKMLNQAFSAQVHTIPDYASLMLVEEDFQPFDVDILIEDNQVFNLGAGVMMKALATPGHTQDHFSYYLPGPQIMFAGEAAGVNYGLDAVSTEFVSDYDAYLTSLHRLAALPAELLCPGHFQHVMGTDDIAAFFDRSITATLRFKTRVLELLEEESGSIDRVVKRYKAEWYDVIVAPNKQPEVPFLINLRARVAHLAGRAAAPTSRGAAETVD